MKVALCFIISYKQIVNKEQIWMDWIEPNKDIINVYFHYKNYSTIQSKWIKDNAIHPSLIVNTSYFHIVPAYISLLKFALLHDSKNQWFCFLTESCVPLVSPLKFRELFFENYSYSIMNWKKAWWNISYYKRANLHLLKEEFHLANDPWFVLNREHAQNCIQYSLINSNIYKLICNGNIANESIFAIILYTFNQLDNVKKYVTHAADWSRMSSSTSPCLFKDGSPKDIEFINTFIQENPYTMFLRKVSSTFPNEILQYFIYNNEDKNLVKKVNSLERKYYYNMVLNYLIINYIMLSIPVIALSYIIFLLWSGRKFRIFFP